MFTTKIAISFIFYRKNAYLINISSFFFQFETFDFSISNLSWSTQPTVPLCILVEIQVEIQQRTTSSILFLVSAGHLLPPLLQLLQKEIKFKRIIAREILYSNFFFVSLIINVYYQQIFKPPPLVSFFFCDNWI